MRRALLLAGVVLCAAGAARAHGEERRGPWGELGSRVPDFAPREERRAPKLPANNKIWGGLGPRDAGRLDDALLVCYVEVTPKHGKKGDPHAASYVPGGDDYDTFNGPDTLFRWELGRAHVAQWGPEDHWKMYISIPAVTLARGERVHVRVWDRDVTTDEYIGDASTRWDGALPLTLDGRKLHLDCNALTADEARAAVQPRLADIDARLTAIEAAVPATPDPGADWRFGADAQTLEGMWQGSFRYAAGFLGWEAPEVASRLDRLRGARARWHDVASQLPALPDGALFQRVGAMRCRGGPFAQCRFRATGFGDMHFLDAAGRAIGSATLAAHPVDVTLDARPFLVGFDTPDGHRWFRVP
jgi:hypothetical protein